MAYIPPNPRMVGSIVPIHGPLDEPLYIGSIYTNNIIGANKGFSYFLRNLSGAN